MRLGLYIYRGRRCSYEVSHTVDYALQLHTTHSILGTVGEYMVPTPPHSRSGPERL